MADTIVYGEPQTAPAASDTLAHDAREGLTATPKRLPAKYLYDTLGSLLFESICHLPWYRPTRAEFALLRRHAADIWVQSAPVGLVAELGSGNGAKLATLAQAWPAGRRLPVHLIDISPAALDLASRTLGVLDDVRVTSHAGTYVDGLARALADRPTSGGRALVLFLGSSIGNFDLPEGDRLLRGIRGALRPGDLLLLGTDLVKPEADLLLAYDDPLGVTAAFNRNLLLRLNRELDASFDLGLFEHAARWNRAASRVEMHLVSRVAQRVPVPGADCVARFGVGESIWTESSQKYVIDGLDAMGNRAGFRVQAQWATSESRFALTLYEAR